MLVLFSFRSYRPARLYLNHLYTLYIIVSKEAVLWRMRSKMTDADRTFSLEHPKCHLWSNSQYSSLVSGHLPSYLNRLCSGLCEERIKWNMPKDLCSTTKSWLVDLSQNMSGYLVGITTVHREIVLRDTTEKSTRWRLITMCFPS